MCSVSHIPCLPLITSPSRLILFSLSSAVKSFPFPASQPSRQALPCVCIENLLAFSPVSATGFGQSLRSHPALWGCSDGQSSSLGTKIDHCSYRMLQVNSCLHCDVSRDGRKYMKNKACNFLRADTREGLPRRKWADDRKKRHQT